VEDGDLAGEALCEPPRHLGRQRHLGDQHDRATAQLQAFADRLEVDLGLAAAGNAVQEETPTAALERILDGGDRGGLLGG
jgi:hypothetical protein